jgi:hypothetical protein
MLDNLRSQSFWWPYLNGTADDELDEDLFYSLRAFVDSATGPLNSTNARNRSSRFVSEEFFENYFYFILANEFDSDSFRDADRKIRNMTFEEIQEQLLDSYELFVESANDTDRVFWEWFPWWSKDQVCQPVQ